MSQKNADLIYIAAEAWNHATVKKTQMHSVGRTKKFLMLKLGGTYSNHETKKSSSYSRLQNIQSELLNQLPPWSRVVLDKLTAPQLVKKCPSFTEPANPVTCPNPETDQSGPRPSILIP
jgi:hypothetical protein